MFYILSCTLMLAGFCLLVLYFILLLYGNKLSGGNNKLSNSFPYLYYMSFPSTLRLVSIVTVIASAICIGVGEALFFMSMTFSYYQLMLAITFPLSLLLLLLSNLLSLNYYKSHIFCSTASLLLFAFSCICFGLIKIVKGDAGSSNSYTYAVLIPVFIIGLLVLLSLINPKLMNWAKMDKAEENGKTIYVRPKINFLALYEWILLCLHGIIPIFLFVNCIACNIFSLN